MTFGAILIKNSKHTSLYFSFIIMDLCIYVIMMAEVFRRFFLIDHIVTAVSDKLIMRDFVWIIFLIFAENILHMFDVEVWLRVTKNHQAKMPEAMMHICEKLPLGVLEQ